MLPSPQVAAVKSWDEPEIPAIAVAGNATSAITNNILRIVFYLFLFLELFVAELPVNRRWFI